MPTSAQDEVKSKKYSSDEIFNLGPKFYADPAFLRCIFGAAPAV
jgi:hypothetical protein